MTQYREPLSFAAGDTLAFQRSFSDYMPANGWILIYELRGGAQPIEFQSTTSGTNHAISVSAATTALWLPGSYVLTGYASNTALAQRFQIYYGDCEIVQNFQTAPGDVPEKTFAQKMLDAMEAELLIRSGAGSSGLLESQIGDTRFKYMDMDQLQKSHGYWFQVVQNQKQITLAKSGRPTGNKIRPLFRVTSQGFGCGFGNFVTRTGWPY